LPARTVARPGRLARGVVQVVELAHAGDPGGEHLAERLARELAQRVRIERVDQAIHRLAPGPEAARTRGEALAVAAQTALESMAVRVHEARHQRAPAQALARLLGELARARDAAVRPERDAHAALEARPGPGEVGLEDAHGCSRTESASSARM